MHAVHRTHIGDQGEDRALKETHSSFFGNQCACEADLGRSAQEQGKWTKATEERDTQSALAARSLGHGSLRTSSALPTTGNVGRQRDQQWKDQTSTAWEKTDEDTRDRSHATVNSRSDPPMNRTRHHHRPRGGQQAGRRIWFAKQQTRRHSQYQW